MQITVILLNLRNMVGKHNLNHRIKFIRITDTELIGNDARQISL